MNLRYVEMSLAQLASKVSVDDAQLKAYYEEQKAKTPERFVQPEQRRVSHILLSVNDPKDDAAVKAKAEGILKRAQGGRGFREIGQGILAGSGLRGAGRRSGLVGAQGFCGALRRCGLQHEGR